MDDLPVGYIIFAIAFTILGIVWFVVQAKREGLL